MVIAIRAVRQKPAISKCNECHAQTEIWHLYRLDEKIRKLDEQLMKHRDAIKKTRPGPAQDAAKRRALSVSLYVYIS